MDKELSKLRRQARTLRPVLNVGRAGVTDAVLRQVRQAFAHNNLIKIRIMAEDRPAIAAAAEALARRVPCRLVQRTGFVATLCALPTTDFLPSGENCSAAGHLPSLARRARKVCSVAAKGGTVPNTVGMAASAGETIPTEGATGDVDAVGMAVSAAEAIPTDGTTGDVDAVGMAASTGERTPSEVE